MTPAADRDGRLVESLRLAEPTAAEELVASYGGRAFRLAIGITGNRADAEEVVQDALWTVVRPGYEIKPALYRRLGGADPWRCGSFVDRCHATSPPAAAFGSERSGSFT
jgi:hypothetical protein